MSTEMEIGGPYHKTHPERCPLCAFELLGPDVDALTWTCDWCGYVVDATTQL